MESGTCAAFQEKVTGLVQHNGRQPRPEKTNGATGESSAARRLGLLMCHALSHDGRPEPRSQIVGQFIKVRATVDFDGFAGGVTNHVAVVAPRQMIVEFGLGPGVQHAIEVIRQLV